MNKNIKTYLSIIDNNSLDSPNKKIGEVFPSLGEQVYKIVKDKIIMHKIRMKERIIDKVLAEELGVSRSMIRQILTALVKEEMLILIPRNGFYVREISEKEIEEIYDIRNILETYAVKQAIKRTSKQDILKIEEEFNDAEVGLKNENIPNLIEIDVKLHHLIIQNCNNQQIEKIINKFENLINFYRFADQNQLERAKEIYYEHYEIFKAVKSSNQELAMKLMSDHIENSKKNILKNYKQYTYGNL